jgi:hypothetical protein
MNFLQKKSMIIRTINNEYEILNFYDFKTTHAFYDNLWKKMYNIEIPKVNSKNNIDNIIAML